MCNEKYSKMGKASWKKFLETHGQREASRIMAERGRKGWLALAERLESEDKARLYVGQVGKASFFKSTRPGLARSLVEPYFDRFPNLKDKFTGDK